MTELYQTYAEDLVKQYFYDQYVLASLRRELNGYVSNWRVLHVDGFERLPLEWLISNRRLPEHSGKQIRFYTRMEVSASCTAKIAGQS